MKNIFEPATLQEFIKRIDTLKNDTQGLWGKMDVSQMMAHCSVALTEALSDEKGKLTLFGIIFGGIARKSIREEKPFRQNLPTAKNFIIADRRIFEQEKEKLKMLLTQVSQHGPEPMTGKIHPFFGKISTTDWSNLMVKHIDHHLRQFNA